MPDDSARVPELLDIAALRARRSIKWHKYPDDVLPAWVADMDFGVPLVVRAALQRLQDQQEYVYPDREGHLAAAFARRMQARFGWQPATAQVLPVSNLVQACFAAVAAFTDPGESVLLQLPSYPPFMDAIQGSGRSLIGNRMQQTSSGWALDFDAMAAECTSQTRLLIFCHPQNPTGRAYSRAELRQVADFAIAHDLVVVSDEIHSDIVYDDTVHIPLASLGEDIAARTVTITSASKSFNIPGLRCAVMHFGSAALQARFNARVHPRLLGGPGISGVDATIAAWDHGQPWLDTMLAQMQANRDWLVGALARELPGIRMVVPQATYLAWLDCSALDLGMPAGQFFLDQAKVGLNGGETFGPEYGAFARMNFATSPAILQELVGRMSAALRQR